MGDEDHQKKVLTKYCLPPRAQELVPTQLRDWLKISEYDEKRAAAHCSTIETKRISDLYRGCDLELMGPVHICNMVLHVWMLSRSGTPGGYHCDWSEVPSRNALHGLYPRRYNIRKPHVEHILHLQG